ncbi:MAG TPA: cysteine desulfurase family protein [Thermoanaerobaculia bacterium]|nr:cysteine desulfurase family protein [Thermoanaerobaculia bacterium]
MEPIYLDHHATTPCDPRVVEQMLPFFTEVFGNPASLTHPHGRRAANHLEDARISIARFFRVEPNEILFTAGATESNNIALHLLRPGDHLITSMTEHKSVLAPAERLRQKAGVEVTLLEPDGEGRIEAAALARAMRPNTKLVSIEAANGEIGTVQPIAEIGALCRERQIVFHSDITQAAGKVAVSLANADLASFSGHKMYGPKGIGGLFVRRGVRLEPVVTGGGQEKGIRSGTVNVPGAVGMAAALQIRAEEMQAEGPRLAGIRDAMLEGILEAIPGVTVNGPRALRLPGNLNVSFERVDAESLIIAMRRFSLSSGSACSSGERGPSRVLRAIGLDDAKAMGSIRIGLGKSNTMEHAHMLVEDLTRVVARLREISAA